MSAYLKQFIYYIMAFAGIWLAMTQINGFAAWVSVSFPIYWVFVFFPAMLLRWEAGMALVFVSALFLESEYLPFRGVMIPLFMGLYLFLYYRSTHLFDHKYSILLGLASLSHFVICLCLTVVIALSRGGFSDILLLRSLQDWFLGQIFLFVLLPVIWFILVLFGGHFRTSGTVGEMGHLS